MAKNGKNDYGQYFTPQYIAEFMVSLTTQNANANVLEPSSGEGIFIKVLKEKGFNNITSYEIDERLKNIFNQDTIFKSFISEKINQKFDLIIGNPPYIRWSNLEDKLKDELQNNELWRKYFNSLCDYLYIFILKSVELLHPNGELIFICPEYWLNTTHSMKLRNYLSKNGSFESIYHFNETPIFDKVTVSLIIFKYKKSKSDKNIFIAKYNSQQKLTKETLKLIKNKEETTSVEYFTIPQFKINERWILAKSDEIDEMRKFEQKCIHENEHEGLFDAHKFSTIGDVCNIGNGLVSGLDSAFQLNGQKLNHIEQNSILKVIKAKDLQPYTYGEISRYIFVEDIKNENELSENYPNFYNQLEESKIDLLKRYNYNRHIEFWEWVFLRNFKLFNSDCDKIFVPCKERISNKNYFRFSYVPSKIFPTQDVTAIYLKPSTRESIYYVLALLNNHRTFTWLKYNGIVKGNIVEFSEKPISSIPFRKINWNSKCEIKIHNNITQLVQDYINTKDKVSLENLEKEVNKLF
jgi:adenine-specific DNA-methyltransferase